MFEHLHWNSFFTGISLGNACLSVGCVEFLHTGHKVEVLFFHQKGASVAETAILNMQYNFGLFWSVLQLE